MASQRHNPRECWCGIDHWLVDARPRSVWEQERKDLIERG